MNELEFLPIPMEAQAFALQVAIGGMCVCAMVLAVARFLRRRPEPLRYGILLAGVFGLLAVPALVGLGRSFQEALQWPAAAPADEVVKISAEMLPELLAAPALDAPEAAASRSVGGEIAGAGLLILWGLGTCIGMGRLLHSLWKQRRALIGSPLSAGFWTEDLKAQLAHKLGLKRFPAVSISPAVPMPMVIGIWRPTIVLPEAAPASWRQPHWEAVLLHEAAHIARRDHWAVLAQRGAVILFWWCPLVYLVARRLNELRENICDDCALQGTCDHIAYAELLVESAERFVNLSALPVPLGLLDSARGGLEARVTRLLEKERPTMTKLSLPGKLLGACFLGAACLLTAAGTAFSGGQSPPQKKIQIKILVDGKEIDLGDAQLWNHIEAAQRKAALDKQIHDYKDALVVKPDRSVAAGKKVAVSPDGKLLVTAGGDRFILMDAKSGKIVAQTGQPESDRSVRYRLLSEFVQSKPDPRIEELVRQAEAIKPGSGAEIRKALQAVPKAGTPMDPKAAKPIPLTSGVHLWDINTGKRVIILIEDGKVRQLNEGDLKKLLDKGIRLDIDPNLDKKAHDKARKLDLEKRLHAEKALIDLLYKIEKADKKPAPTPAAADLEALSRQLERINAELRDLRKRLDAGKK